MTPEELVLISIRFLVPDNAEKLGPGAAELVESLNTLAEGMRLAPEATAKEGMENFVHHRAESPDPGGYIVGYLAAVGVMSFVLKEPDRARGLLRQFAEKISKLVMVKAYADSLETKTPLPDNRAILMPGDGQVH